MHSNQRPFTTFQKPMTAMMAPEVYIDRPCIGQTNLTTRGKKFYANRRALSLPFQFKKSVSSLIIHILPFFTWQG